VTVYRETEDRLGLEEREGEAMRVLGRWRDSVRTRILLAFALAGLVLAVIGYGAVQDFQFRHNHGVAFLYINVGVGMIVPFIAAMLLGRFVGQSFVARRLDAKVAQLARDYELPPERLGELAALVKAL
jgi:hypothetical protein